MLSPLRYGCLRPNMLGESIGALTSGARNRSPMHSRQTCLYAHLLWSVGNPFNVQSSSAGALLDCPCESSELGTRFPHSSKKRLSGSETTELSRTPTTVRDTADQGWAEVKRPRNADCDENSWQKQGGHCKRLHSRTAQRAIFPSYGSIQYLPGNWRPYDPADSHHRKRQQQKVKPTVVASQCCRPVDHHQG